MLITPIEIKSTSIIVKLFVNYFPSYDRCALSSEMFATFSLRLLKEMKQRWQTIHLFIQIKGTIYYPLRRYLNKQSANVGPAYMYDCKYVFCLS